MGLISQVQRSLSSVNRTLFKDKDLTVKLVWKVFVASEFSSDTGFSTETYDEYSITEAIRLTNMTQLENWSFSSTLPVLTQRYSGALEGDSNKKRALLLIQNKDFPPGASKKDLVIINNSNPYSVVEIDDLIGLYYCVEVTERG